MVYSRSVSVQPSDIGVAMVSTDFPLTRKVNSLIKLMKLVSE